VNFVGLFFVFIIENARSKKQNSLNPVFFFAPCNLCGWYSVCHVTVETVSQACRHSMICNSWHGPPCTERQLPCSDALLVNGPVSRFTHTSATWPQGVPKQSPLFIHSTAFAVATVRKIPCSSVNPRFHMFRQPLHKSLG